MISTKNTYGYLIPLIVSFCLLQACTNNVLDVKGYVAYVENEDNGLRQLQSGNGVKIAVQYKPCEYVVFRETKEQITRPEMLSELKGILEGYYYFTLRIASAEGKGSPIENPADAGSFYSHLTYCMTRMQDDLILIAGQDTLACEMFHFERNYNLATYNDFTLGFPAVQAHGEAHDKEDIILLFKDRMFEGKTWRFVFKGDDIKGVPKVNV